MVLPVTLGADTFVYAFGVLSPNIALNIFGTCNLVYNFFTKTLDNDTDPTSPMNDFGTFISLFISLLLHGGILGLLIFNYIDSWKNAKDNAILVLMCIALALNIFDFIYKTYRYSKNEGNLEYRKALTVLHIFGFVGFVTVAIAYPWVGSFANQKSDSRSVLLTTGILTILVFGMGMFTIYRYNSKYKQTVTALINASVKLNVQPKSGVQQKVYHNPTSIRGLRHDLTDDNANTPLFLHAADRARFKPVAGINEDNWKVLKYKNEHYLVSPETAHAALNLQSRWAGESNNGTNNSGDVQFWFHDIYKPETSGIDMKISALPAMVEILDADEFVGCDVFSNKVHGWAGGMGMFFAVHSLVPLTFTLFMFAWYSLYLQQFTSAVLAAVITLACPLLFSTIGFAGQFWELFRWYFLIGWSIINLTNYLVDDGFKYIRQESTWNVTTIPVQEFPEYTSADKSLQILGFSWYAFAYSALALLVVSINLGLKYKYGSSGVTSIGRAMDTAQLGTKFTKEETTKLLKTEDNNLVRRSKYLNTKS